MKKKKKSVKRKDLTPVKKIKKINFKSSINLGRTVRKLREEMGLGGMDLCRRSRDLDPKTLTALEKGRIKNPSVKTLLSISRGFNITISDLFRRAEFEDEKYFYHGSQKGAFKMDFSTKGIQLVSFTPLTETMFSGKLILGSQKQFSDDFFKHKAYFFVMTIVGEFKVVLENRNFSLKEGENLFFFGGLKFSFTNSLNRNSVLSIVTAPSFLAPKHNT